MKKIKKNITPFAWSLLMAGVFVFLVGEYYLVFRAGIPYQDPTPELQLQYAIDVRAGYSLIHTGAMITIVGLVAAIAAKRLSK